VDCIVYLVDQEKQILFQVAAHGPKNPIAFDIKDPITLKIGEGICGNVARTGVSELIHDTSKDPRYKVDDEMRLSELAVPIKSKGKVIGVIDSEHPEKNFYTEDDLEIMETIASMVSVKIDQARSREALENTQEELKQAVEDKTAELKQTIEQLQQSNNEKETLLKEIHHRVKNNLQVVSSLLSLHASNIDSVKAANLFLDCQNRIKSMSVIHEQLYKKGNLSKIDAKSYTEEISKELLDSYDAHGRVELDFDLCDVELSIERSVPFGLILNELLVNAMKHGIGDNPGTIQVQLTRINGLCRLFVGDTGGGFIPSEENESMGLELVNTLCEQLDGKIYIDSDASGTRVQMEFPVD
jgi:two-component sensor histidine kinase